MRGNIGNHVLFGSHKSWSESQISPVMLKFLSTMSCQVFILGNKYHLIEAYSTFPAIE